MHTSISHCTKLQAKILEVLAVINDKLQKMLTGNRGEILILILILRDFLGKSPVNEVGGTRRKTDKLCISLS